MHLISQCADAPADAAVVVPHHHLCLCFSCWPQPQVADVPVTSAFLLVLLLVGWRVVTARIGAEVPLVAAVQQDRLSLRLACCRATSSPAWSRDETPPIPQP